jgi:hypothetical protein
LIVANACPDSVTGLPQAFRETFGRLTQGRIGVRARQIFATVFALLFMRNKLDLVSS